MSADSDFLRLARRMKDLEASSAQYLAGADPVTGPPGTTAGNLAMFADATGKALADGGLSANSFASSVHYHDFINSLGAASAETGRNTLRNGIYSYNVLNASLGDSAPVAYWSVFGFGRGAAGMAEIAVNWAGGASTEIWFRSLRDITDNWWPWKRIWNSGNIQPSSMPICTDHLVITSNTAVGNQRMIRGWGYTAGNGEAKKDFTWAFPFTFDDEPTILITPFAYSRAISAGVPTKPSDCTTINSTHVWGNATPFATRNGMYVSLQRSTTLSANYYVGFYFLIIGTKAR